MFRFWTFYPEAWNSGEHTLSSLEWSLAKRPLTPGEYVIYEG